MDFLLGKKVSTDQLPDRAVTSAIGVFGVNRYFISKASSGPAAAAMSYFLPPTGWVDSLWQDTVESGKNVTDSNKDFGGVRSFRYMPIIGELLYYWTPLGKGFHQERGKSTQEYRSKLKALRAEIQIAVQEKDMQTARQLLAVYNDRRKQGPGDGRKSPLNFDDIHGDLDRKQQQEGQGNSNE
jgi:hypothetical protein